jgi:transketolase
LRKSPLHRSREGGNPQADPDPHPHPHRLRQPEKQDNYSSHGSPLGEEEFAATKANLGWPTTDKFYLPEEAVADFRSALTSGGELQAAWNAKFEAS